MKTIMEKRAKQVGKERTSDKGIILSILIEFISITSQH